MRTRALLGAVLVAILLGGCQGGAEGTGEARPSPSPSYDLSSEALVKLFAYDQRAPLDIGAVRTSDESGVKVERITYADPAGGRVVAIVLSPTPPRPGRLPGLVFAHGSGAGAETFKDEAAALVRAGAVAVLPEVAFSPGGEAAADSAWMARAIVTQRRAVDLLAGRADVDQSRIAFAGHSWGATQAMIMSGVDSRLAAVVVMAGGGRFSAFLGTYLNPADSAGYRAALGRFDGVRYLAMPGRRAVLLQNGRLDPGVSRAEQEETSASVAGTKERKDYDTGHDLVSFDAAEDDRAAFLRRVLGGA